MNINNINEILSKLKNIINGEINIMENSGYIIGSTNNNCVGEYDLQIKNREFSQGIIELENKIYYAYKDNFDSKIIISIDKSTPFYRKAVEIIGVFITQYFEEVSSDSLLKNALLQEIKYDEINVFCERFKVQYTQNMQVIVIEIKENLEYEVENLLHQIYPSGLFTKMHSNNIAFIKSLSDKNTEIEKDIFNSIYGELLYEAKIGVGTVVENIKYLHESYERAVETLKLGKIFNYNKNIFYYSDSALPVLINNMDIKNLEYLYKSISSSLDEILLNNELMLTAFKFFENNLNISETAKKLYIHRNTLIYRLNKIKNISGYDLRIFEDSVNFKIAMYINNFLKNLR